MADVITYGMTLKQARDAVGNLINETLSKQFSGEKIDAYLNQCCRAIYSKSNRVLYRANRDCDIGSREYQIPDAFKTGIGANIRQVFIDSNEITRGQFYVVDDGTTGEPSTWSIWGDVLQLYPNPDSGYTITVMYEKEYLPATNDSDTFMVNDEGVDCAILFAAYMMKLMDEEYTAAGMLRNAYEEAFNRITVLPAGLYSAKEQYSYGRE
jgi:hypothetical protein